MNGFYSEKVGFESSGQNNKLAATQVTANPRRVGLLFVVIIDLRPRIRRFLA